MENEHDESQLEQVRVALREVMANKETFTQETYTQIVMALIERQRKLQTTLDVEDIPEEWSPGEDEIRLVTIMFVDVADSTEIATRLGNETWRQLIGEAQRQFADVTNRWSGEIGQYLGDGVLCFFGARRSRGNDAMRAVACGLAIQERMTVYNAKVYEQYKIPFNIRIGITTGRVVVGTIGNETRSETLAVGATTNLAARLQSICPSGRVAIDTETYLRVRDDFIVSEETAVNLKGFDEPVPYYLVVGQKQQTLIDTAVSKIGTIPIPFLGRDDIVNQIISHIQRAEASREFRVITVIGEIGLGKSRLIQEIIHSKAASRCFIVRAMGHYETRDTDFGLVRDMVAALCDLSDALSTSEIEDRIVHFTLSHWDDRMAEATAEVMGYLGGYGFANTPYALSLQRNTGNQDNAQTFSWVVRWLRGIAGDRLILIFADNLHWADSKSLALLEHIGHEESNVMVLGASRPEFMDTHPTYMSSHKNHIEITLLPFNESQTQRLIQSVLNHIDNPPEDLMEIITKRAEGNPLFVEEFLRMLFDNGVFEKADDAERWQVNTFQYRTMQGELPNGLMGVFQARIDDLTGPARRVVQIASVVGQTFWSGTVSAVAGFNTQPILSNLVTRGIIAEKPESRFENEHEYTFRNILYYEVAYAMLPRANRTVYHSQVADWLAEQAVNHPEILSLLAEHYVNAGRMVDALRTYTASADYLLERGLLAETTKVVEDGRALGGTVPREVAVPLISQLWLVEARAAHSRRRYSEAISASKAALMLMNELPENEMRSERVMASVTLGNAYTSQGNYDDALDALTQAYQIIDSSQDPMEQASVLRAFGLLFWSRGSLEEAYLYAQRAMKAAEQSGSEREMAATMSMLGRILIDRGDLAEALSYFEKVLEINRRGGKILYQILDLSAIAMAYRHLFSYDLGINVLEEAETLCKQVNYYEPLLIPSRGLCYIGQGHHQAGLALLREGASHQYVNTFDRYNVQLALIRGLALTGNYEECVAVASEFTNSAREHNPVLYGRGLLWLGLSQYKLNDPQAIMTLRWALDNETTYGGRDIWLCHYALSLVSDVETAAEFHQQQALEHLTNLAKSLEEYPRLHMAVSDMENAQKLFANWH